MIKTKEVTQEFIKEDRASFELIEKKRQSLDCQEIELKKRITMMKALVQKEEEIHKEEEFDLDLSSLEEAQQTPPAQGRRQHGAAEQRHTLGFEDYRWYVWSWKTQPAWPRRRARR